MILVMVSWCSVSFAELIEFKKCFESIKLSKHDNTEKDVCFSRSFLRIFKFSESRSIIIQFLVNFEK